MSPRGPRTCTVQIRGSSSAVPQMVVSIGTYLRQFFIETVHILQKDYSLPKLYIFSQSIPSSKNFALRQDGYSFVPIEEAILQQWWANILTYWSVRRQRQYFRPMIEISKDRNFSKKFSKRFKPKHRPKSRHLFEIVK